MFLSSSLLRPNVTLRSLIWLYFWLLIFEGILRKWVLPQYSTPLLIVRDPIVIAIYFFAIARSRWLSSPFLPVIIFLSLITLMASSLGQWSTFNVTLFGFRSSFLHFPLIFVIPAVFDRNDVITMGRWMLRLCIPMAILVFLQFEETGNAWINTGAGGGEGGQIASAFGKIRPAGVFSYNNGLASFVLLSSAFIYAGNLSKGLFPRRLLWASVISITLCVGLSGSRSSLGGQIVLMAVLLAACFIKPDLFGRSLGLIVASAFLIIAASSWSVFKTGIDVMGSRVDEGGGMKVGIGYRYLGELISPLRAARNAPLFGFGLGVGTNAGAAMLKGRDQMFLLGEGDLGRAVLESGPILGFGLIALRIALVISLARVGLKNLRQGNPLPWLIWGASFLEIFSGQLGQPTAQGFIVLCGGLCLAAANAGTTSAPPPAPKPEVSRCVRGRSKYAERLHGEAAHPQRKTDAP